MLKWNDPLMYIIHSHLIFMIDIYLWLFEDLTCHRNLFKRLKVKVIKNLYQNIEIGECGISIDYTWEQFCRNLLHAGELIPEPLSQNLCCILCTSRVHCTASGKLHTPFFISFQSFEILRSRVCAWLVAVGVR